MKMRSKKLISLLASTVVLGGVGIIISNSAYAVAPPQEQSSAEQQTITVRVKVRNRRDYLLTVPLVPLDRQVDPDNINELRIQLSNQYFKNNKGINFASLKKGKGEEYVIELFGQQPIAALDDFLKKGIFTEATREVNFIVSNGNNPTCSKEITLNVPTGVENLAQIREYFNAKFFARFSPLDQPIISNFKFGGDNGTDLDQVQVKLVGRAFKKYDEIISDPPKLKKTKIKVLLNRDNFLYEIEIIYGNKTTLSEVRDQIHRKSEVGGIDISDYPKTYLYRDGNYTDAMPATGNELPDQWLSDGKVIVQLCEGGVNRLGPLKDRKTKIMVQFDDYTIQEVRITYNHKTTMNDIKRQIFKKFNFLDEHNYPDISIYYDYYSVCNVPEPVAGNDLFAKFRPTGDKHDKIFFKLNNGEKRLDLLHPDDSAKLGNFVFEINGRKFPVSSATGFNPELNVFSINHQILQQLLDQGLVLAGSTSKPTPIKFDNKLFYVSSAGFDGNGNDLIKIQLATDSTAQVFELLGEGRKNRGYVDPADPTKVILMPIKPSDPKMESKMEQQEVLKQELFDQKNPVILAESSIPYSDQNDYVDFASVALRGEKNGKSAFCPSDGPDDHEEHQGVMNLDLPMLRDAASGLVTMHRARVVHCNLNPEKMILVKDKKENRYRLCFGNFSHIDRQDRKPRDNGDGCYTDSKILFTPPEVIDNLHLKVDCSRDVYSLGATLTAMLLHDEYYLYHNLVRKPNKDAVAPNINHYSSYEAYYAAVDAFELDNGMSNPYWQIRCHLDHRDQTLQDALDKIYGDHGSLVNRDVNPDLVKLLREMVDPDLKKRPTPEQCQERINQLNRVYVAIDHQLLHQSVQYLFDQGIISTGLRMPNWINDQIFGAPVTGADHNGHDLIKFQSPQQAVNVAKKEPNYPTEETDLLQDKPVKDEPAKDEPVKLGAKDFIGEGATTTVYVNPQNDQEVLLVPKTNGKNDNERQKSLKRKLFELKDPLILVENPDDLIQYIDEKNQIGFALKMRRGVMDGVEAFCKNYNEPTSKVMNLNLKMLKDAVSGLVTIKQAGVVHGDIKPDNFILVEDEKGEYQLCFGDFGSLDQQGRECDYGEREQGTLEFAPPEVRDHNSLVVDCSRDVYSLGAALTAMLLHDELYLHNKLLKVSDSCTIAPKRGKYHSEADYQKALHIFNINHGLVSDDEQIIYHLEHRDQTLQNALVDIYGDQGSLITSGVNPALVKLLREMVDIDPAKRPTPEQCQERVAKLVKFIYNNEVNQEEEATRRVVMARQQEEARQAAQEEARRAEEARQVQEAQETDMETAKLISQPETSRTTVAEFEINTVLLKDEKITLAFNVDGRKRLCRNISGETIDNRILLSYLIINMFERETYDDNGICTHLSEYHFYYDGQEFTADALPKFEKGKKIKVVHQP